MPADTSTSCTLEALGTYVFIGTRSSTDLPLAVQVARQILADVDETCSRFRTDSDLTRVNNHPGQWVEVDQILIAAIDTACEAARKTDGLVNPLLGRPLVTLGYDRDFDLLVAAEEESSLVPEVTPSPDIAAWQQIGLDPGGAVIIPVGTALDLGSTGKAWAADLVAAAFADLLDSPALISLGGDIRISENDGTPWEIAISERPPDLLGEPGDTVVVGLDSGGLATSSTRVRQWRRGGVRRHHLLDPRTGLPAPEVWRTATATGPNCTAANTASTVAIVLGEAAPRWLDDRGISARLVSSDGDITLVGDWPEDATTTLSGRRG
ncbi:FAD:protein FMN transferase [Nocardioides sp.]|uniref:FAD:protein FMN transferase n=1 Tax=Nocardioides sp. TaxID=35761 RepID=UPI003D12C535